MSRATQKEFRGVIRVASRIVDYLSSGLYESPAACLKELVNNGYDADAKSVQIFVKPDADRIIISDNGHGLTREDFVRHFDRVSESFKREDGDVTPAGRPKIGKIGIGFIAANEICDVMEIFSTTPGSTELLHVSINFAMMRQPIEKRRLEGDAFAKADYVGTIDEAKLEEHFTRIFLTGLREDVKELFAAPKNARARLIDRVRPRTLYGKSLQSQFNELSDPRLTTWSEFDDYSQNMLQVALNVPVRYFPGWVPSQQQPDVADLEKAVNELDFTVKYDGVELRKPTVFSPTEAEEPFFVRRFELTGKEVAARGYIFAQHGTIRPRELQGLLIRIRGAAVGGYDSRFLGFPPTQSSLLQKWVSVELWADDRLEDAMNIDRKTLRISHPAYLELQRLLHEYLLSALKEVRAQLFEGRSRERSRLKARAQMDSLAEFARAKLAPIDKRTATYVANEWLQSAAKERAKPAALRNYSVTQLYEVVLEVAVAVLPKKELLAFVRRLTERLSK